MKTIPVIDLFAGPGGLSEGFASLKDNFNIAVSIEKEPSAHRTLLLRSFYRQFKDIPDDYFNFLKGNLGNNPEDLLYECYPNELKKAQNESLCLTLGKNNNQEIINAIDKNVGRSPCIVIGGPPCQAYSLAGRSRNKGIANYTAEKDQRNYLYKDYLKIIARYQPLCFVMENVKGMLSAKVDNQNIFNKVLIDLENPAKAEKIKPAYNRKVRSYQLISLSVSDDNCFYKQPNDFIIKSENYGIPQNRHRIFIIGIRADLRSKLNKIYKLDEIKEKIKVKSVIDDLPRLRSGFSKQNNTDQLWIDYLQKQSKHISKKLKVENKNISIAFEDFGLRIKNIKLGQGKNLGIKKHSNIKCESNLKEWLSSERMQGYVVNHNSRSHIKSDLDRYLFCSIWGELSIKNNWETLSPKAKDFPELLIPNHKNFNTGKFTDRFRVQVSNLPASTITSHISKDGHYFIHYDPTQCRSLTVREAARIQTFPDDYFFVGNRTQQYVQVGNAVPPFLAKKIALSLSKLFIL